MEPRAASEFDEDANNAFKCADFIVADSSALVCMLQSTLFEEIDPTKSKVEVIFHGLKSPINAIAVHPSLPLLAVAGKMGFIISWDYDAHETVVNQYELFDKEEPKCMEFSPDGQFLIVGNSNGQIRILDPETLKDVQKACQSSENKKDPPSRE